MIGSRSLCSAVLAFVVVVTACSAGDTDDRVVIAAGTTLVDSGFLEAVVEAYVDDTGSTRPSVLGRSSREAMALAASGDADVTITHEPESLAEFAAAHPAALISEPFASRFVVVAPSTTVLDVASAASAFSSAAESGIPFVSRADGSGTHARERALWTASGVDPDGSAWYVRAGAGMGATLLIASERSAVTLSELGAFLASSPAIDLAEVPLDDATGLDNPYQMTVVDPGNEAAQAFASWLLSPAGRAAVEDANLDLFGSMVYRVP